MNESLRKGTGVEHKKENKERREYRQLFM